jgi:hypothetical protein
MADNASSTPNIATGTPNVATGTPNVASNTPTLVKEIVKGVTVVTHPPAFSTKMTAKEAEDKACE